VITMQHRSSIQIWGTPSRRSAVQFLELSLFAVNLRIASSSPTWGTNSLLSRSQVNVNDTLHPVGSNFSITQFP
jgi:hypothetical protein